MKQKINSDMIAAVLLIILSALFFRMTGEFSNQQAAVWPKAVLVCIVILSAMLAVRGLREQKEEKKIRFPKGTLVGPIVAVAVITVYAVLMKFAGYFISTTLFLPFGMLALGQRDWRIILSVTIGLEIFIYVLFVTQLQLRMP